MKKNPLHDRIFVAHESGLHEMPEALLTARAAVQRIEAAATSLTPPRASAGQDFNHLVDDLVSQAGHEPVDPPEVAGIRDHRHATQDHDLRAQILHTASERARGNLSAAIEAHTDTVIRDYLAPAVITTIAALKAAREAYRPHGDTDRDMLSAPKAARDAWVASDRLVLTYTMLRGVRADLIRASGQAALHRNDEGGHFAEITNPEAVWPDLATTTGSYTTLTPPWQHDDPRVRLTRLIDLGGQFWTPTREQQEAQWLRVFGERLEQHQQNRRNLVASRHAFG